YVHRRAARAIAALVAGLTACLAAPDGYAAMDPAVTCQATKLRAIAKAARGLLDCHARALASAMPVPAACPDAVRRVLLASFDGADGRGGCAVTADSTAAIDDVEGLVAG